MLKDPVEKTLNIYRNDNHRKVSQFFHQLNFLSVPYAAFIAGPRFSSGEDLERVREVWAVKWVVESQALLTESSHLGSSVAEAALNRLKQELQSDSTLGPGKISLLLSSLTMGLHSMLKPIEIEISEWVKQETQIIPLCLGMRKLTICFYARSALEAQELSHLKSIIQLCFERICTRLTWVGVLSDEDAQILSDVLIDISGLIMADSKLCDRELFFDSIKALIDGTNNPKVLGVATAILSVNSQIPLADVSNAFSQVFSYTALDPSYCGLFLQGYFLLAKSSFISEQKLISIFNDQLLGWDEVDFLNVLPSLRLAFTSLSPREMQLLTQRIMDDDHESLAHSKVWTEQSLKQARELRSQLTERAEFWGLINE